MPPPSRNLRMLLNRDESRLNGPSSALPHRIEQKTPAGLVSQPSRYIPPWHHHDVNVNSPFRVRSSPEIFNPSRPAVFPAALVFRAFARQSLSPKRQAGWRKTRRVRLPDLVTGIRVAMRQTTTGGGLSPFSACRTTRRTAGSGYTAILGVARRGRRRWRILLVGHALRMRYARQGERTEERC